MIRTDRNGIVCGALLAAAFVIQGVGQAAPAGQAGLPTAMSTAERKQLLQAAGFDVAADGRTVVHWCGAAKVPAKPAIATLDFNSDGRAEAVVLSLTCADARAPAKLHTNILHRDEKGAWQSILGVDGTIKPAEGRSDGWLNLNVVDGAATTPYAYDAEEQSYDQLPTVQYHQHRAQASRPDRTPPGTLPTAGWSKPYAIGNLTPGQLAQIFTAAGYKRVGTAWKGCDGTSDADLPAEGNVIGGAPIMDLNGDGNPEVIVRDDSFECYNNSGGQFYILSPVPGGWKIVANALQDSPTILPAISKAGWHDIADGGPGFCHSRYRNDGAGYRRVAAFEETKGACTR